jgi:hypothetical protein
MTKNNNKNDSLMQVIYRCAAALCLWFPLQHVKHRDHEDIYTVGGYDKEYFFSQHGWQNGLQIGPTLDSFGFILEYSSRTSVLFLFVICGLIWLCKYNVRGKGQCNA